MPNKDYYAILQVPKTADAKTIRKSYLRLSQEFHPDKNRADPEKAEIKFKEITEAYRVLSDEEMRKKYDETGLCEGEQQSQEPDFPGGPFPGGPGFPFSHFFNMNANAQQQQHRQYPQHEIRLKIHLNDIYNGLTKNCDINVNQKCEECNGTGSKDKIKPKCTDCNGNGVKIHTQQMGPMITQRQIICDKCQGKGSRVLDEHKCDKCKGNATISTKKNITIQIPPLFDYKSILLMRNIGHYDPDNNKNMDIHVHFQLIDIPREINITNTYDFEFHYCVFLYDAWTGFNIRFENHPNSKKYLFEIKEIVRDGDVKIIRNLGLPNKNGQFGNFIIHFQYLYPEKLLDIHSFPLFIHKRNPDNTDNLLSYEKPLIESISDQSTPHSNDPMSQSPPQPTQCVQS